MTHSVDTPKLRIEFEETEADFQIVRWFEAGSSQPLLVVPMKAGQRDKMLADFDAFRALDQETRRDALEKWNLGRYGRYHDEAMTRLIGLVRREREQTASPRFGM